MRSPEQQVYVMGLGTVGGGPEPRSGCVRLDVYVAPDVDVERVVRRVRAALRDLDLELRLGRRRFDDDHTT